MTAELYLPAVAPRRSWTWRWGCHRHGHEGELRSGNVALQFGRVTDGRGVLSATGELLDADIRFELRHQPPDGGFCPHCGSELRSRR